MRWSCVLVLVLLAGCANAPSSPTQLPTGSGETNAGPATPTTATTPSAPGKATPAATTWYLHKAKTCDGGTGDLCNCGSYRLYMVQDATKGACDGGGARGPGFSGCDVECFPADQAFPGYAAGTKVGGSLFLTDDAADQMAITVSLTVNGTAVGSDTRQATIVGTGGGTQQEVRFSFTLASAVPDGLPVGAVAFRLHVEAKESWFLAADPTSHLRVG